MAEKKRKDLEDQRKLRVKKCKEKLAKATTNRDEIGLKNALKEARELGLIHDTTSPLPNRPRPS